MARQNAAPNTMIAAPAAMISQRLFGSVIWFLLSRLYFRLASSLVSIPSITHQSNNLNPLAELLWTWKKTISGSSYISNQA